MMFAVYGLMMMIGALVGSTDAWIGNMGIGLAFTVFSALLLAAGMRKRKKAHVMYERVIESEFRDHGYVEAQRFSQAAQVSMDEARDLLDKHMRIHHWIRTELPGYNAEYRLRS